MYFAYMYQEMLRFNVHVYSYGVLELFDVNMPNMISVYMGTSKRQYAFEQIYYVRFKESFQLPNQFYMYF